ncbi:PIG-L deacetylase family protein [Amycolatopsis pigmentata]|uniref:PIG-L deacetylase family protein n=1 Tax=Amycolatopsis pigmentata TaxID=450801 RepID=A0ABW5FYU4_9PSEU
MEQNNEVPKVIFMLQDREPARLLAISPHLDDAVLSVGAGVAKAARDGVKVTVYTVFAGTASPPYSPLAEQMHEVWGLAPDDDAPLHRRKEDAAALGHLGADYRHGRFLDSIYRKSPDGRWLTDRVTGPKQDDQRTGIDPDLVAEIKEDIKSAIEECDPTLVVTCAAVGGNRDHVTARNAALFAARDKNVPIRLWEDLPYALFRKGSAVELPEGFGLGSPKFHPVGTEVRTRKFQAVAEYPSQLAMLDGPERNLCARLEEYSRKTSPGHEYGERTWSVVRAGDPINP